MPSNQRLSVAPEMRNGAGRTCRQAALAAVSLALALATPRVAHPQDSRFRLDHFTIEDGLAQNWFLGADFAGGELANAHE